jgi:hypothetical protein
MNTSLADLGPSKRGSMVLLTCSCSTSSAAVLDFIAKSCSNYVILGGRVCSNY